jgi:hypothetical protein
VNVLAVGLTGACLVSAACSAPQVSVACSDQAYVALAAECAATVKSCRIQGGSVVECGTLCDEKADDWNRRCGQ